ASRSSRMSSRYGSLKSRYIGDVPCVAASAFAGLAATPRVAILANSVRRVRPVSVIENPFVAESREYGRDRARSVSKLHCAGETQKLKFCNLIAELESV